MWPGSQPARLLPHAAPCPDRPALPRPAVAPRVRSARVGPAAAHVAPRPQRLGRGTQWPHPGGPQRAILQVGIKVEVQGAGLHTVS